MTVGQLIDVFLKDHVAMKLKVQTNIHYFASLAVVSSAYRTIKAVSLKRTHVAALHRSMANTPYSANRMLAALPSCWAWGERHGLLPEGHPDSAKIVRYALLFEVWRLDPNGERSNSCRFRFGAMR